MKRANLNSASRKHYNTFNKIMYLHKNPCPSNDDNTIIFVGLKKKDESRKGLYKFKFKILKSKFQKKKKEFEITN